MTQRSWFWLKWVRFRDRFFTHSLQLMVLENFEKFPYPKKRTLFNVGKFHFVLKEHFYRGVRCCCESVLAKSWSRTKLSQVILYDLWTPIFFVEIFRNFFDEKNFLPKQFSTWGFRRKNRCRLMTNPPCRKYSLFNRPSQLTSKCLHD